MPQWERVERIEYRSFNRGFEPKRFDDEDIDVRCQSFEYRAIPSDTEETPPSPSECRALPPTWTDLGETLSRHFPD